MRIVLDAMGGDNAPRSNVKGAIEAVLDKEFTDEIILVGNEQELKNELSSFPSYITDKIQIVHAPEKIEMWESPTEAYKKKPNSSVAIAVGLLKSGEADAMVSAGNTGAYMTTALLKLGRIKGVARPAIATTFPTKKGPIVLLDVGANSDNIPEHLAQFAVMGEVFARYIHDKKNIKTALLNIGTEDKKGSELYRNAYQLLKEKNDNFVGNIEGREMLKGDVDVVVCDGFVGNIVLKFAEGMASMFGAKIREFAMENVRSKIGALILKPVFAKFKKELDYSEYGGALLVGVNGVCLKAHGSSDAKAIKNALKAASKAVKNGIVDYISEGITK